jgi:hypothetical protein
MPLVFDKEYYGIGYDHNHPIGTCHSCGGITQNHPLNMQLVYNVRVLCGDYNDGYDIFSPPTIEEKINDYDMPPLFDDYGDESNDSYLVEFAPTTIDRNDYAYVGSNNYSIPVAHDKNALCHSYILNFVHDATESHYERGKHSFVHLNNIKFPLFMLKILKLHSFCLPMLVALCFHDLFLYKILLHRKWVRLRCVLYLLLYASSLGDT